MAYPPTITDHASAKPISLQDAQKLIATYLKDSERRPHLHPDAVLETGGPTFSVQGGRQGGLVLHQLRRVEAGLRGEILQPDPHALLLNGDGELGDAQYLSAGDAQSLSASNAQSLSASDAQGVKASEDSRLDALIAEAERAMEQEQRMEDEATSTPKKPKSPSKRKASAMEDGEAHAAGMNGGKRIKDSQINGWQDPEEFARQQEDVDDVGELQEHSNFVAEDVVIPPVVNSALTDKEARKLAKKERKKAEQKERARARQFGANGMAAAESDLSMEEKPDKEESSKGEFQDTQKGSEKEKPSKEKREKNKSERKEKREKGERKEKKDKSEKREKKHKDEARDKEKKKKKKEHSEGD